MNNPLPLMEDGVNRFMRGAEHSMHRTLGQLRRRSDPDAELRSGLAMAAYIFRNADQLRAATEEYAEWFSTEHRDLYSATIQTYDLVHDVAFEIHRLFLGRWRPSTACARCDALTELHARALLISSEIIHSVAGGYPGAAAARWRTLHETVVIGMLLATRRARLSERFLDSRVVELHDLLQRGELGATSRTAEGRRVAKEIRQRAAEAERRHGTELRKSYGWARPLFRKGQITFRRLERRAGQARRRTEYRESSRNLHGGRLGGLEALLPDGEGRLFIGRRLDSLALPVIRTAWSLHAMTILLTDEVTAEPGTADPYIWSECLTELAIETESRARRADQHALSPWGHYTPISNLPSPTGAFARTLRDLANPRLDAFI